ncbi:hypothetical protein JI58_08570 [Marinosulfonomonas sp. PRT-SC04]|nr:hypothetical protein JI58_08570 [Marinosulfonomonas sp. PRT-SC04]
MHLDLPCDACHHTLNATGAKTQHCSYRAYDTAETRTPFSVSFRIKTICASEYRDFFIVNLLGLYAEKILAFNTSIFLGGLPAGKIAESQPYLLSEAHFF